MLLGRGLLNLLLLHGALDLIILMVMGRFGKDLSSSKTHARKMMLKMLFCSRHAETKKQIEGYSSLEWSLSFLHYASTYTLLKNLSRNFVGSF